MRNGFILLLIVASLAAAFLSPGLAAVEWDEQEVLKLEAPPLDVAVSAQGKWIYVLAGPRNILVYSSGGVFQERIALENDVDDIHAGARDDLLILSSRKDKTVRFLTLDFIHNFDVSGSPYRGPIDAPVVIVLFSDYQ